MKGLTITIFAMFFLCNLSAQQQEPTVTTSYRVDYYRPDSMYLIEVRMKQTGAGLRPEITEAPLFARDTAEIGVMIANVKKQADEAAEKSRELTTLANEVNRVFVDLKNRINTIPKQ